MIKEKLISSKLVKKIAATALCAVMAGSCLGTTAFADDALYSFQTASSGSGPAWWLDTRRKEYTDITMRCDGTPGVTATMQLWKNWFFGDVHYDRDQTITVGSGRRVWWFGDTESNAQYHVTAIVSGNKGRTVSFTGYFQTYSTVKNFK